MPLSLLVGFGLEWPLGWKQVILSAVLKSQDLVFMPAQEGLKILLDLDLQSLSFFLFTKDSGNKGEATTSHNSRQCSRQHPCGWHPLELCRAQPV